MGTVWVIIAILAVAIEAVATSFIFVFVGFAALIAALLAWTGAGLGVQVVTFSLLALLSPMLLRRRLARMVAGRGVPSRTDALIGATGKVTTRIDPVLGEGRIIVNGEDWAARSTSPMPVDTEVIIVEADGITLVVESAAALNDPRYPPLGGRV